jgi:hypothetical protein
MKLFCAFLLTLSLITEDVPFKAKEEFEVNLDFKFKTRVKETSLVYASSTNASTGPLPYLEVNLKVLKLISGEVKVRIVNHRGENIYTKKVAEGDIINLDLGYTDDIKGRVTNHEYKVLFLSQDKKPINHILIYFEEDGTYFINAEKRGKV